MRDLPDHPPELSGLPDRPEDRRAPVDRPGDVLRLDMHPLALAQESRARADALAVVIDPHRAIAAEPSLRRMAWAVLKSMHGGSCNQRQMILDQRRFGLLP